MAPHKHRRKRGKLRLVCPHCAYSLKGLPVPGQCPECGEDYDEAMLRAGKKRATPRWVWPIALVLTLLWGAGLLVVYYSEFGMPDAVHAFAFSFVPVLPLVLFVLGATRLMGWLRGPNAGGVVAGFGLAGLLLGGLAILIRALHETTKLNELLPVFLSFYQAIEMLKAMAVGVVIGLIIPPSGRRRGSVSCAALLRAMHARLAPFFQKNNKATARKAGEGTSPNESEEDS